MGDGASSAVAAAFVLRVGDSMTVVSLGAGSSCSGVVSSSSITVPKLVVEAAESRRLALGCLIARSGTLLTVGFCDEGKG